MNDQNCRVRVMVLVIVLCLLVTGCSHRSTTPDVGPHPGTLARDFTATLLNGSTLSLADLKGQPLVLNFWATWCDPCRQEMPLIENIYTNQTGGKVAVLAINYGEEPDVVTGFVNEGHYTFPIAIDLDLALVRAYLVQGIPTTYFIDRNGIIRQVHIGEMTDDLLQSYVAAIAEH